MEWFSETFCQPSMIQAVIMISLVSAVGLFLGKRKLMGISLGITFVFFAGIIAGHFGVVINQDMLTFAQNFGLILFVYSLGLQVGPGFMASFRKGGVRLNMLGLGVIFLGLVTTLVIYWSTDIPLSTLMGLLSGAVTNTPALGAAQQAQLQIAPDMPQTLNDMALGCAVTYPLGVVGVILAIIILRKTTGRKPLVRDDDSSKTFVAEYKVCNPAIYNKTVKDVVRLTEKKFVISRIWRKGKVSIPTSDMTIEQDDHILLISAKSDVANIRVLFGEQENVDWNKEDIDWNTIDSQLISQRILVTNNELNGIKLGSLKLRNLYGINITRINRAGIILLASPDLRLQMGDKITVVGESSAIKKVVELLGDEIKRLDEPNLMAIFIGVLLGVVLGSLPFTIPGISMPLKLGIAGGPIIVGILMGSFGPRFHLTTYTTTSANLMLRQLGIIIYLACLGLSAGGAFFETIFRAEGLLWIGIGFVMTMLPILIMEYVATKMMNVDYGHCIGMICGSMANPMALTYANTTVEGDEPSVSYATVYPLSMFIRVISAQLMLLMFG